MALPTFERESQHDAASASTRFAVELHQPAGHPAAARGARAEPDAERLDARARPQGAVRRARPLITRRSRASRPPRRSSGPAAAARARSTLRARAHADPRVRRHLQGPSSPRSSPTPSPPRRRLEPRRACTTCARRTRQPREPRGLSAPDRDQSAPTPTAAGGVQEAREHCWSTRTPVRPHRPGDRRRHRSAVGRAAGRCRPSPPDPTVACRPRSPASRQPPV